MKVPQVLQLLKENQLLDEREIYRYASSPNLVDLSDPHSKGLVLLSVCRQTLYILEAHLDNTYGKCYAKIDIEKMFPIQAKATLFKGELSFVSEGNKYFFTLPAKSKKFVEFFMNNR